MSQIAFKIEGVSHLLASLKRVKPALANKYLRQGVTKAARIVRKSAVAKLSTGTDTKKNKNLIGELGLLREAMDFRVRVYGDVVVGVIGPASGHRKQIGVRQKTMTKAKKDGKITQAGDPIYHDPAKIAHLVEFGHGGPHPAGKHAFMRPAFEETQAAATAAIREALQAGIVKEFGQ